LKEIDPFRSHHNAISWNPRNYTWRCQKRFGKEIHWFGSFVDDEDAAKELARIDAIVLDKGLEAALKEVTSHTVYSSQKSGTELRNQRDSSMAWLRACWIAYEETEVIERNINATRFVNQHPVLKSSFKEMYGPLKAQFDKLQAKWKLLGREITIADIEFDHIVPIFLRRPRFAEEADKSSRLLHWNIQVMLGEENNLKNAWYPGLYLPEWLSGDQYDQIDEIRWELVDLINDYNPDSLPHMRELVIYKFQTLSTRMRGLMDKFEKEHFEQIGIKN
jgi:hypothetical protein